MSEKDKSNESNLLGEFSVRSHAEICPVCGGSGKVIPKINYMPSAVPQPVTCHGCGGLGWVTVK